MNRRRVLLAGIGCAALLLLGACGLPQDKEPQKFALPAQAEQALKQASSTSIVPVRNQDEDLYYVNPGTTDDPTEHLVRVRAPIKQADSPEELSKNLLEALKTAPVDRPDLRTSLTENTQIDSVRIQNSVADVNFGRFDLQGRGQYLASAQIVFTLTDLPQINAVRFFVNGQPAEPTLENSTTQIGDPVTRNDYRRFSEDLDATSSSTTPPNPGG